MKVEINCKQAKAGDNFWLMQRHHRVCKGEHITNFKPNKLFAKRNREFSTKGSKGIRRIL